ncbi:MAG: mannose-1-phosphate guanylyltransferase [Alphaproteobacteria bacterium]|nr:mannose-1-phosphate guanylyltransferase [Alphaproteobacteria bacterium]MBV9371618.1 mannose-1-phosphate guanylyltransferase [Alphaproteobacteria bacterium]MBV9901039.1 mannose-1-phosphate guanylyltransferase [Alphaproteobacteria bacterium]
MSSGTRIRPVILSGGAGTRLWPLSRLGRPKQLVSLTGDSTMLQQTAARVADSELFAPPLVVAGEAHADEIEAQLGAIGLPPARLILEPAARSTAAAAALAALAAPDELLLVLPSDHAVGDEAAFLAAVAAGREAAEQGWLVTFGAAADRPETGYGYVRRGEALTAGAFRADAFAEKPDAATAARYLADGGWLWNTGLFLFKANAFLDALGAHAPEVLAAARASLPNAGDGPRLTPDSEAFAASPSASIDRAVMERSERVAVVPVEMDWSDIGSWDAVHARGPRDPNGNLLSGDVVAPRSANCLIRSDGPTVVALGVSDLVIVATERAVLVVPRGDTQRVQEAIDALIERRGE